MPTQTQQTNLHIKQLRSLLQNLDHDEQLTTHQKRDCFSLIRKITLAYLNTIENRIIDELEKPSHDG